MFARFADQDEDPQHPIPPDDDDDVEELLEEEEDEEEEDDDSIGDPVAV